MGPDGKPFSVRLMVEGDLRPVMTRAGTNALRGTSNRIFVSQRQLQSTASRP